MTQEDKILENFGKFAKLCREHLTSTEMEQDRADSMKMLSGLLAVLKRQTGFVNELNNSITLPLTINAQIEKGVVNEYRFWEGFKELISYPSYLSLISYVMRMGINENTPITSGVFNFFRLKNEHFTDTLTKLRDFPLHRLAFTLSHGLPYNSPLNTGFLSGCEVHFDLHNQVGGGKDPMIMGMSLSDNQGMSSKVEDVFKNSDMPILLMLVQRAALEIFTMGKKIDLSFSLSADWEFGLKDGKPYAEPKSPCLVPDDVITGLSAYFCAPYSFIHTLLRFNAYLQVRKESMQVNDVRMASRLLMRAGLKKAERLQAFLEKTMGVTEPSNTLSHQLEQFTHFKKAATASLTEYAGNTPAPNADEETKAMAEEEAQEYAYNMLVKTVGEMMELAQQEEPSDDLSRIWLFFCYLASKYSDFIGDNFHANFHPDGLNDNGLPHFRYSLSQWETSVVQNFKTDLHTLPVMIDNHLIAPSFFLLSNHRLMLDDATAWYMISEKFLFGRDVQLDKDAYVKWVYLQSLHDNPTLCKWFQEISASILDYRLSGYVEQYGNGLIMMPFFPMLQRVWMEALQDGLDGSKIIQTEWSDCLVSSVENQSDDEGGNTPSDDGFDD